MGRAENANMVKYFFLFKKFNLNAKIKLKFDKRKLASVTSLKFKNEINLIQIITCSQKINIKSRL